MLSFLNGKNINDANATISVNNRSFRYGDGFFETMLYRDRVLVRAQYHWHRIAESLKALHFQTPEFYNEDYYSQTIHTLVAKNGVEDLARIRLCFFRGDGGLFDTENMQANLLVQTMPLNPDRLLLNTNGLILGMATDGFKAADALSNLKSNNYLLYALAANQAKQNHWNDAIVLNHYGRVADTTIANIWVIADNKILTPPLTEGPVAGTVRQYILENQDRVGLPVVETPLDSIMLQKADGIFLTNAIYGVKWVKELEGTQYAMQPAVMHLHKMLMG